MRRIVSYIQTLATDSLYTSLILFCRQCTDVERLWMQDDEISMHVVPRADFYGQTD